MGAFHSREDRLRDKLTTLMWPPKPVEMRMSAYNEDFVVWSKRQAGLLRRVAAGEAVDEAPDWPNLIQEIEGFGHRTAPRFTE